MPTHLATFSEILKKSIDPTKKYILTYVLGILLIGAMWLALRVVSSVLFTIADMNGAPLVVSVVSAVVGIVFGLLMYIVQFLPTLFPLVTILEESRDVIGSLKKSFSFILRSFLISVWVFLRSFAWLALIGACLIAVPTLVKSQAIEVPLVGLGSLFILAGMISALILFPRFSFAFIILVKEHAKARACVRESYKRTYGYWGKIVGNTFLIGLVFLGVFVLFWLAGALTAVLVIGLSQSGMTVAAWIIGIVLGIIIGLGFIAFVFLCNLLGTVFKIKLYETIHAHPIHRKMK
jgi:hypothetical protein